MISFSQSPGECGAFCECFAQVVWSLYRVFGGLRYRPATLGSLWHVSRTGQAALARGSMVEKPLKQDFPGSKNWKGTIFLVSFSDMFPIFPLFSVAARQKSWVSLVEVQFFWRIFGSPWTQTLRSCCHGKCNWKTSRSMRSEPIAWGRKKGARCVS